MIIYKDCIYNSIPTDFKYLTQQKKIPFKGKKLKTSYIINLMHDLIKKYIYTQKEQDNNLNLSSLILKSKYGQFYNYYIEYLCENKFIRLSSKYYVHKKTNTYKIDTNFVYNTIKYKNCDKILVKKINNDNQKYITKMCDSPIDLDIREKLIYNLSMINIDFSGAIEYLEKQKSFIEKEKYQKNLISIENIQSKDIFFKFDEYGRFHTNYTILKKEIRKNYLTINKEMLGEIDIPNSQPLFFAILLKKDLKEINTDTKNFFNLVKKGLIYDDIVNNSTEIKTRTEAKKLTYKVLFGKNFRFNKKENKIFKSLYPSVYEYILEYKEKKKNYKELSYQLQRMESNFIFNTVIKEILEKYPDILFFTVHDSIIFPLSQKEKIETIFQKHFKKLISDL